MLLEKSEPPGKKSLRQNEETNYKIPLPLLIPYTAENKIFYENGLAKFIQRLKLKVHSKTDECFLLWEKFSKKESLFDLWDFRYSWFQGYQYTPCFYTIYEGKNPLALLPLWFDKEDGRYEWFGSEWMEDNYFFTKDTKFISLLLKLIPQKLFLNAIDQIPGDLSSEVISKQDDDKYIKIIKNFKNVEDCLKTIPKKYRYNLKKDYLRICDYNPRIEFVTQISDDLNEFEEFKKLSIGRFSSKNGSDLVNNERVEAFKAFIKNRGVYQIKFIKVYIQNRLAASDLILMYNKTYYTPRSSCDIDRFSGIGNFMFYLEFEDAIKNGFEKIDCLQVDYGYKHRYFEGVKKYIIEKE